MYVTFVLTDLPGLFFCEGKGFDNTARTGLKMVRQNLPSYEVYFNAPSLPFLSATFLSWAAK
jgi:hypothetical protein